MDWNLKKKNYFNRKPNIKGLVRNFFRRLLKFKTSLTTLLLSVTWVGALIELSTNKVIYFSHWKDKLLNYIDKTKTTK